METGLIETAQIVLELIYNHTNWLETHKSTFTIHQNHQYVFCFSKVALSWWCLWDYNNQLQMIDLVLIWTKSYEELFCKKSSDSVTSPVSRGISYILQELRIRIENKSWTKVCCKFMSAAKSFLFVCLILLDPTDWVFSFPVLTEHSGSGPMLFPATRRWGNTVRGVEGEGRRGEENLRDFF